MTLRIRDLHEGEAEELARTTRSRTLGAGLVRRAQIVQHAVDGLNAPDRGLSGFMRSLGSVLAQAVQRARFAWTEGGEALGTPADLHARRAQCRHHRRAAPAD